MDINGEAHLHGIGIVGGLGLHANGDFALFLNLGHPIHAFVCACFDADLLDEILRRKVIPLQLQGDLDLPRTSQVVVDYGAEGDLVLLHEEAWGLQTDQQILACDDLGFTLSDHSSVPHGPDLDLPGGEIVRHGHFDLGIALLVGLDVGLPEGGVGEVASDRASASSTASLTHFFPDWRLHSILRGIMTYPWMIHPGMPLIPPARSELLNDAYTPPDKLVAERNRRPLA